MGAVKQPKNYRYNGDKLITTAVFRCLIQRQWTYIYKHNLRIRTIFCCSIHYVWLSLYVLYKPEEIIPDIKSFRSKCQENHIILQSHDNYFYRIYTHHIVYGYIIQSYTSAFYLKGGCQRYTWLYKTFCFQYKFHTKIKQDLNIIYLDHYQGSLREGKEEWAYLVPCLPPLLGLTKTSSGVTLAGGVIWNELIWFWNKRYGNLLPLYSETLPYDHFRINFEILLYVVSLMNVHSGPSLSEEQQNAVTSIYQSFYIICNVCYLQWGKTSILQLISSVCAPFVGM